MKKYFICLLFLTSCGAAFDHYAPIDSHAAYIKGKRAEGKNTLFMGPHA